VASQYVRSTKLKLDTKSYEPPSCEDALTIFLELKRSLLRGLDYLNATLEDIEVPEAILATRTIQGN
jgi:hypothetical protein